MSIMSIDLATSDVPWMSNGKKHNAAQKPLKLRSCMFLCVFYLQFVCSLYAIYMQFVCSLYVVSKSTYVHMYFVCTFEKYMQTTNKLHTKYIRIRPKNQNVPKVLQKSS